MHAVCACLRQDQVDKGIMFTEPDRVELHSAVVTEMEDLAGKASKGYALALFCVFQVHQLHLLLLCIVTAETGG